jgi:MacB-like periplasmic core domain
MTDLEQRVSSALQRLAANAPAETEPVEQLRRRVHRRRARRASGTAFALLLAVALVAGVATLHHSGSGASTPQPIRVGAPDLLLGDIDAVVVSSRFDADGARAQIPVSVLDTVSRVPGVQVASGVLQEFATITDRPPSAPPRTPIVFSYHEPDELHLLRGRLPQANNEIVANADFLQRETATVGQTVTVRLQQTTRPFTIVGEFDLPQGSTAGIPLLAVAATQSLGVTTIDRVDVKVAAGADPEQVRARIAAALGGGYAAISPTSLGYGDQRLAQLGIQHAYWSLLSPDPNERHAASESTQDPAKADATYAQHASETAQAELRVENVAFVSPDAATLTYRIYYDGVPSPYIPAPQAGAAVRVDGVWKIASSTACALANLTATPCAGQENAPTPPTGWKTASTLDADVARSFRALADPGATVDERVAAVADGTKLRAEIEAGLQADQRWAGKVHFVIVGWQPSGDEIQVLYALTTDGGGPATPYPLPGSTVHRNGRWYAPAQYACGLQGLANQTCSADVAHTTESYVGPSTAP